MFRGLKVLFTIPSFLGYSAARDQIVLVQLEFALSCICGGRYSSPWHSLNAEGFQASQNRQLDEGERT